MRISIFGLGYVGAVSAGCLAGEGHQVLGIDPVADKVDLINRGLSPIVEAEINEVIAETVHAGSLRATQIQLRRSTRQIFPLSALERRVSQTGISTFVTFAEFANRLGTPCEPRRTAYGRNPQHDPARNHARCRYSDPRGALREKGRGRFRHMQ